MQRSDVESVGEKVVNEGTKSKTVGPGRGEVLDVDIVVLPGATLTPDQDGLHLRGQTFLPGDAELDGQSGMCRHPSTLAVPE